MQRARGLPTHPSWSQRVCSSGRQALALLLLVSLIGLLTVVFGIMGHRGGSGLKRMEEALQRVNRSVSMEVVTLKQAETDNSKKLVKLDQTVERLTAAMIEVKTDAQGKIAPLRNTLWTVNCDLQDTKRNRTGWDSFSRSCYWVSRAEKPWEEAKADCEDRDSHLVTITSYLEQQFVARHTMPRYAWIGLAYTSESWKWVDGSPYTVRRIDWKPGQPYSHPHRLGSETRCVHLHRDGLWSDAYCPRQLSWVCEMDLKG